MRPGPGDLGRLDRRTQLAERTMVLDDLEQRIVTEAVRPLQPEKNPTSAGRFRVGSHVPLRIGKGHVADELGVRFSGGNFPKRSKTS